MPHLLDSAANAARIKVEYSAADGSGVTASNAAGKSRRTVAVSVREYPVEISIAPIIWNAMKHCDVTVQIMQRVGGPFPARTATSTLACTLKLYADSTPSEKAGKRGNQPAQAGAAER